MKMKFLVVILFLARIVNCDIQTRIIEGERSLQNEFPFVVSFRYNNIHHCAGSIIRDNYVLTAAHCLLNGTSNLSHFSVVVGSNKITAGEKIEIDSVKIHKDYKGEVDWWKNDVAILKLKTPLKFTDSVKKITIRRVLLGANETVTAIGWGSVLQPTSFLPNFQQKLTAKTLSHWECKQIWPTVVSSQLCFWNGKNSHKGICTADSGGPLIAGNKLVGILSWTPSACTRDKPDVAVRLAPHFLNWINENIGKIKRET